MNSISNSIGTWLRGVFGDTLRGGLATFLAMALLILLSPVARGQITPDPPVQVLELSVPQDGSLNYHNKASELVHLQPGYSYQPQGSGNYMHAFIDPHTITPATYAGGSPSGSGEDWPPQLDPSKAVGFTPGTHGVSPTGAATYDIPIQLPPGTAGMVPSLSISYNSQSGNGLLGMGWNMGGLSAISRVPKTIYHDGAVRGVMLDADDIYALDGNRLVALAGAYGADGTVYGTEQETFARITSYGDVGGNGPEWFEVKTKEGMTMEYGNTPDSRFTTQGDGAVIVHRISKMTDPYGNYVTYKYRTENRQSVIDEIRYTGNDNAGVQPYNVIQFEYMDREDKNTVYVMGPDSDVKSHLLLRKVRIIADGQHFKNYEFAYGTNGMYSFLKSVTESGSNGDELNSTVFRYGEEGEAFTYSADNFLNGEAGLTMYPGDYNGDGLTDILTMQTVDFHSAEFHSGCHDYYDDGGYGCHDHLEINPGFPHSTSEQYTGVNDAFCSCWYLQLPASEWDTWGNVTYRRLDYADGSSVHLSNYIVPVIEQREVLKLYLRESVNGGFVLEDELTLDYGTYQFHGLDRTYLIGNAKLNGGHKDRLFISETEIVSSPQGHMKLKRLLNVSYDNNILTASPVPVSGPYPDEDTPYLLINSGNSLVFGDFLGSGEEVPMFISLGSDGVAYNVQLGTDQLPVTMAQTDVEFILGADKLVPIDFNGDGKTDLMTVNETLTKIYSFGLNGGGMSCETIYSTGYPTLWHHIRTGDFNGDGKADLLTRPLSGSEWTVAYSDGTSFNEMPFQFPETVDMDQPVPHLHLADFNGDGFTDVLHAYAYGGESKLDILFSSGRQQFHLASHLSPSPIGTLPFHLGDFNGDGKTDLLHRWHFEADARVYHFHKDGRNLSMAGVTNGFGISTEFTYTWLPKGENYSKSGTVPWQFLHTSAPIQVVKSVSGPDGDGGISTSNYSFKNATLHRHGRGFIGFEEVQVENSTLDRMTISTTLLNTDRAIRLPIGEQVSTIGGTQLSGTTVQMGIEPPTSSPRFHTRPITTTSTDHITNFSTTTEYEEYDDYGNVKRMRTTQGEEVTTVFASYGAFGSSVPSRILGSDVTRQVGSELYERSTEYEYNAQGSLTREIRDPGTAFTITTLYEQFDAFGNPGKATVSASGVANRVTEYQYDPKGRFATRVTNTLGQHTHYTYDGRWGQPLTVTDITGHTATSQYDAFGRLKSATDALGHTSTTAMVWDVGAHGSAVYRMDNQSPGAPPASTWFDAYNRELRSETEGYNGPVAATKKYDARGRTEEGTMPSPQSTGAPQPIVQTMGYDNLNRLQTVSDGTRTTGSTFGMVGTTYSTTVTDPGGRERTQRVDIHGRVVRTDDPAGHLTFEYDIAGRLKKTTGHTLDGSTVLTEMEYDLLGHQTLLRDVDAGETQYVHNAFGEMTSQTDAIGQNHTMQYDAMGRITQRTGPDGTTTYQYVTSGNGLNQLRKVTAPNGTMQEYTYDDLSRVSSLKETVDGKVFTTSYTYDNFGRVKDITYPAGLTVSHAYDGHGHLTTVTAGGTPIYSLGGKNDLGQVTQYTLGNGVTTTKTINEHGHLTAIDAPGVQHLTMDFDPLTGTMNWRRDNLKGLREDFGHDGLDRLLEAELTDAPQPGPVVPDLNVHYDLQGNIEIKSDVGEYSYDSERVHAVESITDPDGSISREDQTITYTPYGRRTATINEIPHSVEFTYGPDNERKLMVLMEGGEVKATRYYHGNYEEVEIGNDTYLIHYIGGGDGLAAIRVKKNDDVPLLYYVYKDHLGSILTLTDEEGDIAYEQSFDAWGRYRDPDTWQVLNSNPSDDDLTVDMPPWMTRGYTGHEHLREFDLINMNGRMYDATIGRMLAPDNFVQDPYNTQSYNRYSYVWNNPLANIDPSGEFLIKYLTDAYNKKTWDPYGWGNGGWKNMQFQVGYSQGNAFIGFSPNGATPMMYGNFNVESGNFSTSTIPGYINPKTAGNIGNINMRLVDNAKSWASGAHKWWKKKDLYFEAGGEASIGVQAGVGISVNEKKLKAEAKIVAFQIVEVIARQNNTDQDPWDYSGRYLMSDGNLRVSQGISVPFVGYEHSFETKGRGYIEGSEVHQLNVFYLTMDSNGAFRIRIGVEGALIVGGSFYVEFGIH